MNAYTPATWFLRYLAVALILVATARAADPRSAHWFYNPFSADSAHHRPIGTGAKYNSAQHNTGHIPYGSLWALPTVEKGGPDLARLGLSEKGRRLAECIRNYGIYAVDGGGATALRADQDFDPELVKELKAESAKFYRYIRLVENSVPESGKIVFQVGDSATKPSGGPNQQIIPGNFPAGGGEPLAPNTAIVKTP